MGESLSTTLTSLTTVFTSLMTMVGKVIEVILDQPLLFIPLAIPIVYTAINVVKRLFH